MHYLALIRRVENVLTLKSTTLISALHQDVAIYGRIHDPGGTRCVRKDATKTLDKKATPL
jgi:hypothetical protein